MSETPAILDTIAIVERNDLRASGSMRHYGLLRLRIDRLLPVLPGQFAMIKPHGIYEPLLRRAMAYYRSFHDDLASRVEFIYQVLGRGTQSLAKLKPGDLVDFLGSLGNTYDIEASRKCSALLVAGGVGSAALYMLAEELIKTGIEVKLFIGGANRGDLCGLEDFIGLLSEENVICATIDGTQGTKGLVTVPLEDHLKSASGRRQIIYACGPDRMMHRVSRIAERYGLPAQLSLEAPMGCGYGVCVGCAVAVKQDCPEGHIYLKVCTDGPIFWSRDLYW